MFFNVFPSNIGPSMHTRRPSPMQHCPQMPIAHFMYRSSDAWKKILLQYVSNVFIMSSGPQVITESMFSFLRTSLARSVANPFVPFDPSSVETSVVAPYFFNCSSKKSSSFVFAPIITVAEFLFFTVCSTAGARAAIPVPPPTNRMCFPSVSYTHLRAHET